MLAAGMEKVGTNGLRVRLVPNPVGAVLGSSLEFPQGRSRRPVVPNVMGRKRLQIPKPNRDGVIQPERRGLGGEAQVRSAGPTHIAVTGAARTTATLCNSGCRGIHLCTEQARIAPHDETPRDAVTKRQTGI
jgi:hypothetical protein